MDVPAAALSGWTGIRTGGEEAFLPDKKARYERLIGPLESQLMRSAWRIVRHPDLAEDAFQETLLTVWKKLERVERHPNPQALVLKIGLDAAYDALRKKERRRRREEPYPACELPTPTGRIGATVLERKEIEEEVLAAITRLPKKQAAAVLMRLVQDQPYAVIALALGCRETTARIHVSQGRARLSRELSHLSSKSVEEDIR
jgi:RNA polymerase sigma factor (sigma-70 family)